MRRMQPASEEARKAIDNCWEHLHAHRDSPWSFSGYVSRPHSPSPGTTIERLKRTGKQWTCKGPWPASCSDPNQPLTVKHKVDRFLGVGSSGAATKAGVQGDRDRAETPFSASTGRSRGCVMGIDRFAHVRGSIGSPTSVDRSVRPRPWWDRSVRPRAFERPGWPVRTRWRCILGGGGVSDAWPGARRRP